MTGKPHATVESTSTSLFLGGGRTPDAFKAWMRQFANSREVEVGIRAILKAGAKSPLFLGALKHVTEHGYGKPKDSHEFKGEAKITVEVVYSHE